MNEELAKKYEHVSLPTDLRQMFAEIILQDEATRKVFSFIAKNSYHPKNNQRAIGVTIAQISREVEFNTIKKVGSRFEKTMSPITSKTASKIVEKLCGMGLCYFKNVSPAKPINLTNRGFEVGAYLKEIKQTVKE